MSSPEALLEEAFSLTKKMLELAEEGEWEALRDLEQKQSGLLKACFESKSPFEDKGAAAKIVQEILDLHEKIIAAGAQFGSHVREELTLLQKGRDASRAYLRHSK
jgi:hypothetical protein